jgi:ribonucleoside-diphosphate reductase beta chain
MLKNPPRWKSPIVVTRCPAAFWDSMRGTSKQYMHFIANRRCVQLGLGQSSRRGLSVPLDVRINGLKKEKIFFKTRGIEYQNGER